MKILRTIAAVLMAFALLVFSLYNWQPVELMLWHNLVLETKVPVLVVIAFLLGFVPLLTYHSSVKWGLKRRIKSLENSMKMSLSTHHREPPAPFTPPAATPVDNSGDKPGIAAGEAAEPSALAPETAPAEDPRA